MDDFMFMEFTTWQKMNFMNEKHNNMIKYVRWMKMTNSWKENVCN
jgi:hypothetical protein